MRSLDLLALPFDQFQRYSAAAQIADLLRVHLERSRLGVLDVGGFYRTREGRAILPLAHFLPQDRVIAADLVAEPLPNYVLADGQALPFARSFDLVVSCDTLEHVPPAARPAFVDELLRVTDHLLVLITPIGDESTRLAERVLCGYMSAHGLHHVQLQEHAELGLPSADSLQTHLADRGLATAEFADGYLHHWLAMMLVKHTPGYSLDFQLALDRYYNRHFSPGDRREPAYRRAFVIAQPGDEALLATIANTFRPADPAPDDSDFIGDLVRLLSQNQPEDLRPRLAALETENARLRELVAGYEQGRFIRLMRWLWERQSLAGR